MNEDIMKHCTYSQDMVYGEGMHIMSSCVIARGRYMGFDFVAINIGGRHPCGYVNVRDTEFNRKHYDEIDIECHGGLTFAEEKLSLVEETGWWIGWDYAHSGDYEPYLASGKRYTTEEVVADCLDVIDQIGGAASKSAIKSDCEKHAEHILAHYTHAREKHPYFCDRLLPIDLETSTPEDVIDFRKMISQMLSSSRDNIRARIKDGDLTYSDVVGCELWEVDEALANNDKAHAIEELYDCIAVCLRAIDVIEGRQKLGKPEMKGEAK